MYVLRLNIGFRTLSTRDEISRRAEPRKEGRKRASYDTLGQRARTSPSSQLLHTSRSCLQHAYILVHTYIL